MRLYRLAKTKYAKDLSGKGAEMSGGRWNSKGTAMIYTSSSIALATTEVAVHVPLGILPKGYVAISIEFPDSIIPEEYLISELPSDWKSIPHANSTQVLGDDFVKKGTSVALKVPSAVVAGDYNYLLNPSHPMMKRVKIIEVIPYDFDPRLFIKS